MRVPLIWAWRVLLGGFAAAYLPEHVAAAVDPTAASVPRGPCDRGAVLRLRRAESEAHALSKIPGRSRATSLTSAGQTTRARACLAPLEGAAPTHPGGARPRLAPSGLFLLDRSRPCWQKLPAHERAATLAIMTERRRGSPVILLTSSATSKPACRLRARRGRPRRRRRTRMWITPGICYRLAKVPRMSPSTETASGHAIAVLAHEAWHLHGVQSEALANCYAYQSGVQVGRAFGLSAGTARRLMHEQLADNPGDFAGHGVRHPARLPPGRQLRPTTGRRALPVRRGFDDFHRGHRSHW